MSKKMPVKKSLSTIDNLKLINFASVVNLKCFPVIVYRTFYCDNRIVQIIITIPLWC